MTDAVEIETAVDAIGAKAAFALGLYRVFMTPAALKAAMAAAGWSSPCEDLCPDYSLITFWDPRSALTASFSSPEECRVGDFDKWLYRLEDIAWEVRGPSADFKVSYWAATGVLEDLNAFDHAKDAEFGIKLKTGRLPARLPKRYRASVRAFLTAVRRFQATHAALVVQRAWRRYCGRPRG